MIPLYTQDEFNFAKSFDLLPLECIFCKKIFKKTKHYINNSLNPKQKTNANFCSKSCSTLYHRGSKQILLCSNCDIEFSKTKTEIKKTKNHFCSKSCAASYNNKHKSTGTRRSKLEIYLEEQLTSLYPKLHIDYNKKEAINSELDIYLPSLRLAFELNGIFHYEPIYGSDKLNQIQNNDSNKFQQCIENEISLCVIDTSSQKYFKESTSKKYLDIIVNIINQRTIEVLEGLEPSPILAQNEVCLPLHQRTIAT